LQELQNAIGADWGNTSVPWQEKWQKLIAHRKRAFTRNVILPWWVLGIRGSAIY